MRKSKNSEKSQEFDLVAHPGSLIPDGQYKFNLNTSQLDGLMAGLYVLDDDNPELLELYGPDNKKINWEKNVIGRTRNNYIVLPLSSEEAFERDRSSILKYKKKKHIIILEMENETVVLQFDNDDFIDGLHTIFELANMDLEDYVRPIPT